MLRASASFIVDFVDKLVVSLMFEFLDGDHYVLQSSFSVLMCARVSECFLEECLGLPINVMQFVQIGTSLFAVCHIAEMCPLEAERKRDKKLTKQHRQAHGQTTICRKSFHKEHNIATSQKIKLCKIGRERGLTQTQLATLIDQHATETPFDVTSEASDQLGTNLGAAIGVHQLRRT